MDTISELLLADLAIYGAPLFGLALLLGAAGFPIPTSLMVVAAGAFSRQGTISWYYAALLGLAGAVIGDSISFALGRWGGKRVIKRFGNSNLVLDAQSTFNRGSGLAVFFTRFLMTAVALPVNLLAGMSCRYRSFLSYALAGEALWIILYGGMGYLFSSQWDFIVSILGGFGWFVLVLAFLAGGLYLLFRKGNRLTTFRFKTVKASEV